MAKLWINDSGASTEEIERGVAAAEAVFAKHGWTARECWDAELRFADGDSHDDDDALTNVWAEAESAAYAAAFAGWARWPEGAVLVLEGAA